MAAHEERVRIDAPVDEVFRFLSNVSNVPLFAPGIDEATLLGGAADLQGAWLGLRTRSGRELRAQITHIHENEGWTVVDERSTVSQVQLEPDGAATTLLVATLKGDWRPDQEKRVLAEWLRKLNELPGALR